MKRFIIMLLLCFPICTVLAEGASFDEDIEVNYEWVIGPENYEDWEDGVITDEVYCLAEAIYFEAGNQPVAGKIAVADVIINRKWAEEYPDTICEVVHQGPVRESWKKDGTFYPIRHKCQFSYFCDGRSDTPKYGPTWHDSIIISEFVIMERDFATPLDSVEGATHYHATYVHPHWADHMQRVVQIEDHVFYK